MVHPSRVEISRLAQVAREIRETAEDAGFTVDTALDQNAAFTDSRGPTSSLERSLVLAAARRGASSASFGIEEVAGGGLDLVSASDGRYRTHRVKRVTRSAQGGYEAMCGAGSTLLIADCDSLLPEERWILGFVTDDDHTIGHMIAAEVINWTRTGPVRLVLGNVIELSEDPMPSSFTSTDERLDGFDDEADADTGIV